MNLRTEGNLQEAMEIAEYVNAIAYLSEQVEALAAKQDEYHTKTWEKLEQWSEINLELVSCLQEQAQDNRASTDIYQSLAQHLLTFAQITQQLTSTTSRLEGSSEKLVNYLMQEQVAQLETLAANNQQLQVSSSQLARYLIEEQSPRLESLDKNSQQLQTSSSRLETYLKTEQSQRLKLLEISIRTLLEMMETSQKKTSSFPIVISSEKSMKGQCNPPNKLEKSEQPQPNISPVAAITHNTKEKQNFSLSSALLTAGVSSLTTLLIVALLWSVGGIGKSLASIAQRSEWSITKLERLESALGVEN